MRGIARVLLRENYVPRSLSDEGRAAHGEGLALQQRKLGTIAEAFRFARANLVVPFQVAILLYQKESRVRYEFDLVDGRLLTDLRMGRLPINRRVRRSSRLAWNLDSYIARSHLSLLATRVLESLFETKGLTGVEVSHLFGGIRELVDSALQTLMSRDVVVLDRRTGIYRPRLEAFSGLSEPARGTPEVERGAATQETALKTSVSELLAAADSKATCPLCGRALPASSRTSILCDDCAREVGTA